MPSKVWAFALADGEHTVELEYSYVSSRERFFVDGNLLSDEHRWVLISRYPFTLASHQCEASIRLGIGSWIGRLTVDGKSVEMLPSQSLLRPSQADASQESSKERGVLLRSTVQAAALEPVSTRKFRCADPAPTFTSDEGNLDTQQNRAEDDDLIQLLDEVHDRASFFAFVRALATDRAASVAKEQVQPSGPYEPDANGWENTTIEAFFEAALAWAEDSGRMPEAASWQAFATFLYGGKIYE